jgi:thiosulfate dehydrogenase
MLFVALASAFLLLSCTGKEKMNSNPTVNEEYPWRGWNMYQLKPEDSLARLGFDLVRNTAYYFGPHGKIAAISNGMNCQNCHVSGGTIPWGNNFSAVVMSYPKLSFRSGKMMSIARRVNDCFERSLNGVALDTGSHEMHAIIAYMHWIGDDIPKSKKPPGAGIMQLPFMDRPADPAKGNTVYTQYCSKCHGDHGQGIANAPFAGYLYPPLWGENSYNSGAGLYRIGAFAGFVKNNMPSPATTFDHPALTDSEAWDVAAFVNSRPRPLYDNHADYPDISKKPIDESSGPYSDTFSQQQHKFGPFKPINAAREKRNN